MTWSGRCWQCGQPYTARACGLTHAMLANQLAYQALKAEIKAATGPWGGTAFRPRRSGGPHPPPSGLGVSMLADQAPLAEPPVNPKPVNEPVAGEVGDAEAAWGVFKERTHLYTLRRFLQQQAQGARVVFLHGFEAGEAHAKAEHFHRFDLLVPCPGCDRRCLTYDEAASTIACGECGWDFTGSATPAAEGDSAILRRAAGLADEGLKEPDTGNRLRRLADQLQRAAVREEKP